MDEEAVRARLDDERARTTRRWEHLSAHLGDFVEASRDTNADDEHDPEGTTIAFERSQVVALRRQAARDLEEIAAATARLDSGTYGGCETCGRPIPEERLEVRPTARTHVGC